jgi:uncharacterized radical SAM superfamily protein
MEKSIILTSGRCAWARCFACGWGRLAGPRPSIIRVKKQIDEAFRRFGKGKVDRLKVFCSGSFLDDSQFHPNIRKYLVAKCQRWKVQNLIIESRPEFVTADKLRELAGIRLTVAMGLEIADNEILRKYEKGFTVEDYIKAAKVIKAVGARLRTYLMVGLPFVRKQAESLRKSVMLARRWSDEIVLINTFPHAGAPLFGMWLSGKWRPLDRQQFEQLVKPYPDCEHDFANFQFIPRIPRKEQILIKGATERELLHPFYEVWQDYICRFYEPPAGMDIALFIPCAFRKPYYKSRLHRAIHDKLRDLPARPRLHLIVISSPGVIPYELANFYPFNRYDWPEFEETPTIKKKYIQVTQRRIERYLKHHARRYKKFYCYFKPDSESAVALHRACKKLKIKLLDCLKRETYQKIKGQRNPLSLRAALLDLQLELIKIR